MLPTETMAERAAWQLYLLESLRRRGLLLPDPSALRTGRGERE
jgi:hypothetical protein